MGPDQKLIDEVIATFPKTFGLRNFPDETFRISPMHSYFTGPGYGEGRLMLYTERKREDGSWASFAKGTEYELRDNLVKAPSKNLTTDDLDIVATNMIAGGHENASRQGSARVRLGGAASGVRLLFSRHAQWDLGRRHERCVELLSRASVRAMEARGEVGGAHGVRNEARAEAHREARRHQAPPLVIKRRERE
jgi:hypothetical protein